MLVAFAGFSVLSMHVAGSAASSGEIIVPVSINGGLHYASLQENTRLLQQISSNVSPDSAVHYRGHLLGHPGSEVRLSRSGHHGANEHWVGVVLDDEQLYRVEQDGVQVALIAKNLGQGDKPRQMCGATAMPHSMPSPPMPAYATQGMTTTSPVISFSSTLPCSNPIGGVCLLPHIELAYDTPYQNIVGALSPIDRAIGELNEMELFFERGLGYRFSQLSLTMLNTAQNAVIDAPGVDALTTLIGKLNQLRGNGSLGYLTSDRSIFHFSTGHDFPPDSGGNNVVGVAYVAEYCSPSGHAIAVTDAADLDSGESDSLVSLVMAHEIGHVLGANHDDDTGDINCPAGQYVMTASIGGNGPSITDFSSCSVNSINSHVYPRNSPSCNDYPVDVSSSEASANVAEPPTITVFNYDYQVQTERYDTSGVATRLALTGRVDDIANGRFVGVSVPSGNCSLLPDGSSYYCLVNSAASTIDVSVQTWIDENAIEFSADHEVVSSTSVLVDVISGNNTLNQFYNSFSMPGTGGGTPDPDPDPITAYIPSFHEQPNTEISSSDPEPETPTTVASSGGGGGVVSVGLLIVLLIRLAINRSTLLSRIS